MGQLEFEVSRMNRQEYQNREGSPWRKPKETYKKAAVESIELDVDAFKADVAARTGWAANLLERGWVKFATFKQMARWYRETLFG